MHVIFRNLYDHQKFTHKGVNYYEPFRDCLQIWTLREDKVPIDKYQQNEEDLVI